MTKINVVGIGYRPFDKRARKTILGSEIILASNRLFEVFKGYEEFEMLKDKIMVINNVEETINHIKSKLRTPNSELLTIVLLASGDPMFFGIGRRIVKEFGEDMVEIFPDLSSIQIAFSKIKEPWDDTFLVSLHGGSDPNKRRRLEYELKDIPFLLARHNKIAILTDKVNNPSAIAKEILKSSAFSPPLSALKMFVCERLCYPDEKIIEGTPAKIAEMSFLGPNVVIILNTKHRIQGTDKEGIRFGIKEDEIIHSRGLITKDEVRAVTIHKLRLPQNGVFWDIGAGSGSISIEALRICPELKIFAIEKKDEQIENIIKNKKRFNIANIEIIKGEAPDALRRLTAPDRVFIGGSGGRLKEVTNFINENMISGIIVINATTLETLNEAITCLENARFKVEISEVCISRSKMINQKRHMNALNPVFIIVGER